MFLLKKDQELVAICSLQRSEDTLILYGRLGAIALRYRGAKLAYIAPALMEAMGRAMGMEVIYGLAEFMIPNMQMVLERAGFQIVGIVPASDRLMVTPGITKRVYEAIYDKVLAADADVLRPQPESMTPRTKALYDFYVRFWPKADIASCTAHVRFRGSSGHGRAHCECPSVAAASPPVR